MAKSKLESALLEGLQDALDFEKGKKRLFTKERKLPKPAPEFSQRSIKKLRKDFNLTQEDFARVLNVEVSTIRSWEQGTRKPTKASNRLLQIFKLSPELIDSLAK